LVLIIDVVPYGTEIVPSGLGTYVIWRYEPHMSAQTGYVPAK
jgi:hypothetical protein